MNTQEQFEAIYADYTQTPIEQVVAARLGEDSYDLPKISSAWVWYNAGKMSEKDIRFEYITLAMHSFNDNEE